MQRAKFLVVYAMMAFCFAACGECRPIAPDLRSALASPRWQVRRDVFERIAGAASVAHCVAVRDALIKLQQKEVIASWQTNPDLYEDDDYNAYVGQLMTIMQKIAVETNLPVVWKGLVRWRYNGDSRYGNWLSMHRGALPFLLRELKSRNFVRRGTAVEVISLRLFHSRSAKPDSDPYVSPAEFRYLKAKIRMLARTDIAFVSQAACMGLGLIGDQSDIALLQEIANSKKRDIYTKKFAQQAIKQIQGDANVVDRLRTKSE